MVESSSNLGPEMTIANAEEQKKMGQAAIISPSASVPARRTVNIKTIPAPGEKHKESKSNSQEFQPQAGELKPALQTTRALSDADKDEKVRTP